MPQRRSGKYRVQYRTISGHVKSATFDRKADAQAFEEKVRRDRQMMRAGLEMPKESVLVLDYAGRWIRKRFTQKTYGTVEADARRLKEFFLPYFGLRPASSITSAEVREHLDDMQAEHAWKNASRNRLRALLHKMFRDMYMDEIITANPVSRVPLLEEKRVMKEAMTASEIADLIAAARASMYPERDVLFVTIAAYQGPRISELVSLQHRDFDLERGLLHFRRIYEASTGQVRERIKHNVNGITVPMFPAVEHAYRRLTLTRHKRLPDDFVFQSEEGSALSTRVARQRLYDLCDVAGIRRINPHLCRATFATIAEEAGWSKEEIQRLMGHKTILTTERYTRGRVKHLVDRAKILNFASEKQKRSSRA